METEKVLFIIPSLNIGGAELQLCEVVNVLISYVKVEIWIVEPPSHESIVNRIDSDVKIIEVPRSKLYFKVLKNRHQYSKVICFALSLQIYMPFDILMSRNQLFVFSRSNPFDQRKLIGLKLLVLRIQSRYLNGLVQSKLYEGFFRNSIVLPNMIAAFEPEISSMKGFTYIGRLSREKNLPFIFQSYEKYRISGGRHKFYIFGDGPERDFLVALKNELSFGHDILFFTSTTRSRAFSVTGPLVLMSFFEGMPNVVLEAISIGKKVFLARRLMLPEFEEYSELIYLVDSSLDLSRIMLQSTFVKSNISNYKFVEIYNEKIKYKWRNFVEN